MGGPLFYGLKTLFVLGLILQLMACAPTEGPLQSFRSDESPAILDGTPVQNRKSPASKSVVLVELLDRKGNPLSLCSGVLISTHTVLTAAHCFDPKVTPGVARFNIIFNEMYRSLGVNFILRQGVGHITHPRYNSIRRSHPIYDHDIAVAAFTGTLPKGFQAADLDSDRHADYAGAKVYSYGFGRFTDFSGRPHEHYTGSSGLLRRGEMRVDRDYKETVDRYFITEDSDTHICSGDSGGPQFFQEASVLKVIGIHSAAWGNRLENGNSTCSGRGQITKVNYFYPWIKAEESKLVRKYRLGVPNE